MLLYLFIECIKSEISLTNKVIETTGRRELVASNWTFAITIPYACVAFLKSKP